MTFTLDALLKREVLQEDDIVIFAESKVPDEVDREWDSQDEFWRARVAGKTGQQNNIEWLHENERYSFTGLTREILHRLEGRDKDKPLNGYAYWTHPEFGDRTLLRLRKENATEEERKTSSEVV